MSSWRRLRLNAHRTPWNFRGKFADQENHTKLVGRNQSPQGRDGYWFLPHFAAPVSPPSNFCRESESSVCESSWKE